MSSKFQVGDTIKIVSAFFATQYIGKVGKIVDIAHDLAMIQVDQGEPIWFEFYKLELISSTKPKRTYNV